MGSDAHLVLYPINQRKELNLVCIIRKKTENNDSSKTILENTILKENKNLTNLFRGDLKLWPIYTSGKPIKSIYKNVLYIGDAFYTFPPTMAQGASQSIEAANEIFELISGNHPDIQSEYFKNRVEKTNLINKRSKINYFGFHISNPLLKILRNEFLKRLVKNKNFIQGEKCNQGEYCHCEEISNSKHLDVLEMDAASKTGIDDVRELIDSSKYNPTSAKYKIIILDEVHMLSKQAFNGLLKTLEEPPPHLKFIFATTEVKKIPIINENLKMKNALNIITNKKLGVLIFACQ